MTIAWCGSLSFLLNQLRKSLFRTENIPFIYNDKIKRIGVYYMCLCHFNFRLKRHIHFFYILAYRILNVCRLVFHSTMYPQ